MAWIAVDLDETLVTKDPMSGQMLPIEGAPETMQQLFAEGHRLTVFTSRFAPMPESRRQEVKGEIEQEMAASGFPEMEVWTGTTKPDADVFIGSSMITFDQDWGLVLAQTQMMLEERGLVSPPTGAGPEMQTEEAAPGQVQEEI